MTFTAAVTTTMVFTILLSLIAFTPGWMVDAQIVTYQVAMNPLFPTSEYPVFGFATIFADTSKSVVGYAGIASNLESLVTPSKCTALNACGVHIHSGRSCANVTTQGGHYFNNATIPIDPWIKEEYTTDKKGKANFQSIVKLGTVDIEGRVFIVHSMNGTRVACGVVEKVPATEQILKTTTKNLTSAGVSSTVLLYAVQPDTACYFGAARNLEPNLVSFLNKNTSLMGKNCNATNGCGVHLHNGTSCFNTTTQGGHYYNKVKYPIDPWLYTMYGMTDRNGNGYFTGCVQTGFEVSRFLRRPFIIHSNNGTRVSCGLLTRPAPAPVIAPVPAPVKAPVKGAPDPAPSSNITAPVMAPSSNVTAPIVAPVISPTSNYTAPIKSPTSNDTAPVMAPVRAPYRSPVKAPVEKACGLFRLQLFCPLTGCGIFGRLFGLC